MFVSNLYILFTILSLSSVLGYNANCGHGFPKPEGKSALIVVDVQNDFCEGGSLAVSDGDAVIPVINKLRENIQFDMVVLTQDWHPSGHVSFYSRFESESGAAMFQQFEFDLGDGLGNRTQVLWPDHCVQGSEGAEFRSGLHIEQEDLIVQKGTNLNVDSYSAFLDNDKSSQTILGAELKKAGVTNIIVTGLAFDYCVGSTALDGKTLGFQVFVVDDASRSVADESRAMMEASLKTAGVFLVQSKDIIDAMN